MSTNMTLVVIIVKGSAGSVIPIEIKLTTITSTISNRRTYDRGLLKNTICRWLCGSSKRQICLRCLSQTFLLNQWHRIFKSFHLLVLLQYYRINLGKNFNIIWYFLIPLPTFKIIRWWSCTSSKSIFFNNCR